MRALFVRRSAFEALERFSDTEIWRLRRENKALKEREAARVVCVRTLEERAAFLDSERERLLTDNKRLCEENAAMEDAIREIRHRLDLTRADLSRAQYQLKAEKLMKDSLEARIAAPCEM